MAKKLGQLESVPLRDIWKNEKKDFTPWLAEEANLQLLGDTIEMELELEALEKNVGSFQADILCKRADDNSDSWVVIENQIEKTDHTHLGQILTYAAGLDALTMIWVAKKFRDEHRAVIDWLNEITDEKFHFFGLEIEAWKIGSSPPAPKFKIISKPNDWSKSISQAKRQIDEEPKTETQAIRLRYWQGLHDFIESSESKLQCHKPRHYPFYVFSIGKTGFLLQSHVRVDKRRIGVELFIKQSPENFFNDFLEDKESIEKEIGSALDWKEQTNGRIALWKNNVNPKNENNWKKQHQWLKETLEKFDKVFRKRIKNL